EAMAAPEARQVVLANAPQLQAGSLRLLLVVIVGGAVLLATERRRLQGGLAAAALIAVVAMDQWSVLQAFARWLPPAAVTYADDELIRTMNATPLPYRTYDPAGQVGPAALYKGSILMAHEI